MRINPILNCENRVVVFEVDEGAYILADLENERCIFLNNWITILDRFDFITMNMDGIDLEKALTVMKNCYESIAEKLSGDYTPNMELERKQKDILRISKEEFGGLVWKSDSYEE